MPSPSHLQPLDWRANWRDAPGLLWLEGEPGIGKSHTLRGLSERVSGDAILVLKLPCAGWLAGALRAWHGQLEGERDGAFLEAARRVAPELRWARVAQISAPSDQNALWGAVAHALERLARRVGGLALLLEDAHEASPDDLGALRALYRRALLGKTPLRLALTARPVQPDPLEGFLQDATIANMPPPERVSLARLDEPGVAELLREALHSEFLPDELSAWLHARAEGHPLHTLELLRFLRDGGALRQAGAIWVFRPPSGKAVPRQLEAVLQARLLALRADDQGWRGMTALSVLERAVSLSEWAHFVSQSREWVLEVAHRLEHGGFVREGLESGETVFSIAHPLYAPLLRAQLQGSDLRALHERAIQVSRTASERARHARACGYTDAAELTRQAFDEAGQAMAFADVIAHGESLLALDPGASDVRARLAQALFVCGETERALEVSLGGLNSLDGLEIRFHILMRLGRYAEALDTARLGGEQDAGDIGARLNRALALMHLERLEEARAAVDALLLEFPEPSARRAKGLDILSDIVYSQGDLVASLDFGEQAAQMLRDFNDEKSLAITLSNLGGCCVHFGLWAQGRAHLEEAIRLFTERGGFQHVMFARNNLGFLMIESGEYLEPSQSLLLGVCQQAHAAQESRVEAAAYSTLADLAWQGGNLELAWQYHGQSQLLDQRESEGLVDQAHLEALRGHHDRALELLHAPQVSFHIQKTPKRARTALLIGHPEEAIRFLNEAETAEDHDTRRAQYRLLRGLAQYCLSRLPEANADLSEAQHLARLGQHRAVELEARLSVALIGEGWDEAAGVLGELETLNASGHSLTVQTVLSAQWAQLQRELGSSKLGPLKLSSLKLSASVDEPLVGPPPERTMLRTLGAFSLERAGKTSPWRASKTRELLAVLLVAYLREDGPSVPRAQLIEAIWPDSSGNESTENKFRVTLMRLRDSLKDAASIKSLHGAYQLDSLNADVTHFLHALERLDFDAALGWYRGSFLPDVEVADTDIVRAQLWGRFRDTALRASLEGSSQAGVNLLERLHHLEPLDTTLLQRLSECLIASGDSFRLQQTLLRARTIFQRETGEVPAELLRLERTQAGPRPTTISS